ncbi:uncharacterized protein LOC142240493 [Haematobia irritans]|uniref:uncharacterized protein LOC142240493 n=1 Tax=Haematobia irritans TaxID=7368 RepID=UPI003F500387
MSRCRNYSLAVIAASLIIVGAIRYEFAFDDEDVFQKCEDRPETNSIHDIFDMSKLLYHYYDGSINVTGNITCAWKGVKPTDRIHMKVDVLKFVRGTWQPTVFTLLSTDFCMIQYSEDNFWYEVWSQYIPEDERKCLNNYGHVYHMRDYNLKIIFDDMMNREGGRYKLVITGNAFDEYNMRKGKSICIAIPGSFYKI